MDQTRALTKARRRCRNVAIATFFSAILTAATTFMALTIADGRPTGIAFIDFFASPWMSVDVGLTLMLGIGVWRCSRAAAVILFGYFLLNRIAMVTELGFSPGVLISLLFGWYYWLGMKAAFAHHRIRLETDPAYRPMPVWGQGAVYTFACLFLACFGFATWMHLSPDAPQMRVVREHQLPGHFIDGLTDAGIVLPTERIDMFYSEALFDYLEAGNVLTDMRLISYETVDGTRYVESTLLTDIRAIRTVLNGDFLHDTVVSVTHSGGGGGEFLIVLSADRKGDEMFLHRLELRSGHTVQGDGEIAETPRNIILR